MVDSAGIDTAARQAFEDRRYEDAYERYLPLAHDGWLEAMLRVGWMLRFGQGVAADADACERWYRAAAENGDPLALFYLGDLFWHQDKWSQAFLYMSRAAEQHDPPALYRLGTFHEWGVGTPKDFTKAKELYERAAELGHLFARRQLVGPVLRGQFGAAAIPRGLLEFLRILRDVFREGLRNPGSDLLRK